VNLSAVRGGSSYYFNSECTQTSDSCRCQIFIDPLVLLQDETRFLDTRCIDDRTAASGSTVTCHGFHGGLILQTNLLDFVWAPITSTHSKGSERRGAFVYIVLFLMLSSMVTEVLRVHWLPRSD
jgi:hypothetical protein